MPRLDDGRYRLPYTGIGPYEWVEVSQYDSSKGEWVRVKVKVLKE